MQPFFCGWLPRRTTSKRIVFSTDWRKGLSRKDEKGDMMYICIYSYIVIFIYMIYESETR
nr:MAG TPA: hypothetical protein [Caudoviricetes sp.]